MTMAGMAGDHHPIYPPSCPGEKTVLGFASLMTRYRMSCPSAFPGLACLSCWLWMKRASRDGQHGNLEICALSSFFRFKDVGIMNRNNFNPLHPLLVPI